MTKSFIITFKLPSLPSAHTWQSATVEASDIGLAIKRAWNIIKKRPIVKGRRIKQGEVKFEIE